MDHVEVSLSFCLETLLQQEWVCLEVGKQMQQLNIRAIVESVSPELGNRIQRVRVQLPGLSQELLHKSRPKNIDFAAHNGQEDQAYEIALGHIMNNREAVDKIVEVLLDKETMSGDEFLAIQSEFTVIPHENRVATSTPTPVQASV
ncbi:hypothetical protein Bca52824_079534 [Brassica carinata]|uniref:Uncharacterized protein n=1 Tax=Brassica carinata TaxID=52824 RepID=A0A8X7PYS1_BRACI|nr:hypothetical protein Bca52824_079534 [Brassica carinata]